MGLFRKLRTGILLGGLTLGLTTFPQETREFLRNNNFEHPRSALFNYCSIDTLVDSENEVGEIFVILQRHPGINGYLDKGIIKCNTEIYRICERLFLERDIGLILTEGIGERESPRVLSGGLYEDIQKTMNVQELYDLLDSDDSFLKDVIDGFLKRGVDGGILLQARHPRLEIKGFDYNAAGKIVDEDLESYLIGEISQEAFLNSPANYYLVYASIVYALGRSAQMHVDGESKNQSSILRMGALHENQYREICCNDEVTVEGMPNLGLRGRLSRHDVYLVRPNSIK